MWGCKLDLPQPISFTKSDNNQLTVADIFLIKKNTLFNIKTKRNVSRRYLKKFFAQMLLRNAISSSMKTNIIPLPPTNYVLVFDDVSFLEGTSSKMQISAVKQAVTKIILINNYHYSKGLDNGQKTRIS